MLVMCGHDYYMATIGGLWAETIFYGLYVAIFIQSIILLVTRRRNKYFLLTSIAMFILCTIHLVIDFLKVILAPAVVSNSICTGVACLACGGNTQERLDQVLIQNLLAPIGASIVTVVQFLAQGLLIYRCIVIWKDRQWVALFPSVFLIASTGICFVKIYAEAEIYRIRRSSPLSLPTPPLRWTHLNNLVIVLESARVALVLMTNLTTTTFISLRIWQISRELEAIVGKRAGARYYYSIAIVLESGAIYCIPLIIDVIVSFAKPALSSLPNGISSQFMGIAPTLIIVRVGMGKEIRMPTASMHLSNVSEILTPASRGLGRSDHDFDMDACETQAGISRQWSKASGSKYSEWDVASRPEKALTADIQFGRYRHSQEEIHRHSRAVSV
ncbi:hypothetical protein EVG20_g5181 [Dentipellis fragilis]|uniref:G-protein coupled receptors family 1 profile domain-containing protein n=1 Tax=Dentipellis fragilis TaxID=205917 RepID=A0A4Y9YU11_9AGAM|nr:hypothetical protein EVG20_g5181 [Dentipellis fragilis]